MREDVQDELWVWRPILRQMCTVEGVKSGQVSVDDIIKLNGLIDMIDYYSAPEE